MRYWLILIVIFLMLLVGKTISPNQDVETERRVLTKISTEEVKLNKVLRSAEGDKYRLSLVLTILENDIDFSGDKDGLQPVKFNVSLLSDLGEKQDLGAFEHDAKSGKFAQEVLFETNGRYSNILIWSEDEIEHYDLYLDRYEISKLSKLEGLDELVSGSVVKNIKNIESFHEIEATNGFSMMRKNQIVGQIVNPESEILEGVAFKLKFQGNGGFGEYRVVLREVDGSGKISKNDLAFFEFNTKEAEKLYIESTANQIYHFPMVAKLDPGKQYFVGISNSKVIFNWLNHLKIYNNPKFNGGNSLAIINNKQRTIPQIYSRLLAGDFNRVNGEVVAYGSSFQDNGNNISFSYSKNNLDVLTSSKQEVVYKINTVYPIKNALLTAALSHQDTFADCDPIVEYSSDNQTWYQIDKNQKFENMLIKYSDNINYIKEASQIYIRARVIGPLSLDNDVSLDFSSIEINAELEG